MSLRPVRLAKVVVLFIATVSVVCVGTIRYIAFRRDQATKQCVFNLQRIDGAKQQWALENYATQDAEPTWFDIYYYGGRDCDDWPAHCPSGGFYVIGRVGNIPQCSISGHAAAFEANGMEPKTRIDRSLHPPLTITAVYQKEMRRLMIAEAERVAEEIKLEEQKPIMETNVTIWPPILSVIFRGSVAGLRTQKYQYTMSVKDSGIVVSRIARNDGADWPNLSNKTSRYDTNQTIQLASELLTGADVDVGAMNRDCVVLLDPWFRPFDSVHTVAWRQREDTFFFRAGHVSADVTFHEPTKSIVSIAIYDDRYVLRKPLEALNMVELLSPKNSREAVLDAEETATNYVKRIHRLQKSGAPETVLRNAWLDYTTAPFPTNFFKRNTSL